MELTLHGGAGRAAGVELWMVNPLERNQGKGIGNAEGNGMPHFKRRQPDPRGDRLSKDLEVSKSGGPRAREELLQSWWKRGGGWHGWSPAGSAGVRYCTMASALSECGSLRGWRVGLIQHGSCFKGFAGLLRKMGRRPEKEGRPARKLGWGAAGSGIHENGFTYWHLI